MTSISLLDIKFNENLINIIKKINPVSFIIFGSYARNCQNISSDIDFMIFFTRSYTLKKNFNENIIYLKKKLQELFKKKIDLIIMEITNKIKNYDEFNIYHTSNNFIYNVLNEGVNIFGIEYKNIILESIIYKKI